MAEEQPLHALIALEGTESSDQLAGAVRILSLASTFTAIHVFDERITDHLITGRKGFVLHRDLPESTREAVLRAESEAAGKSFGELRSLLNLASESDAWNEMLAEGKPERVIVDASEQLAVDLVLVFGRRGERPGPHSVGKVARFVIDHVRCTAVIVH